jgi:2'-5' RNA ligase
MLKAVKFLQEAISFRFEQIGEAFALTAAEAGVFNSHGRSPRLLVQKVRTDPDSPALSVTRQTV